MEQFYPGSKRPLKTFTEEFTPPLTPEFALGKSRTLRVGQREVDFYPVGILAKALNRETGTIRKWENEGVIPKAVYILPGADSRGKRRLYTKEQILGLRDIAMEEGLLDPGPGGKWPAVTGTQFKVRALKLFKELENA